MIRLLTIPEVPKMLPLAHDFFVEQRLPGILKDSVFIQSWAQWLQANIGIVIGAFTEQNELMGAIGGLIFSDPYDGELVVNEMFWFMHPDYRNSSIGIRLLAEFERVAKERKAKRISMVHLARSNSEKLKALYERRGYQPMETHYIREVVWA